MEKFETENQINVSFNILPFIPNKIPPIFLQPFFPNPNLIPPPPNFITTLLRPPLLLQIHTHQPLPSLLHTQLLLRLSPIHRRTPLPPKLQEIVKLFQSVQEPKAKYQQLLFYGKELPPLDPQFKTTENKVQGCVSQVWVRAFLDPENKNVTFEADSDSVLTKGLAALLVNGLSGQPIDSILCVSPDFVVLLGLQQSLTPSRNNGFLSMLNLMQNKAKKLYAEMGIGQEFELEKYVKSTDLGSGNDDGVGEVKAESSSKESVVNEQPKSSVLGSSGERIKKILRRELRPVELEVEDISYQHAGHAGVRGNDGETHFNLKISKEFEGKSLVKRHRLIYGLLEDELQSGLHALSIEAKTPTEVGC